MNPGRDVSKPLVEIPEGASRPTRVLLLGMRWYLVAVFALGLLTGVLWLILALTSL